MEIVRKFSIDGVSSVYIAKVPHKQDVYIEFAEALTPPLPVEEKVVFNISTLYGCPVKCQICDAGILYRGKLSKEELFAQIDYLIKKYIKDGKLTTKRLKIQFSRMGEPSFNPAVLDVLEEFPQRYPIDGFLPSLSTIAPKSTPTELFFERLITIKNNIYPNGNFQLQFSIHTTDESFRDRLLPVKKWSFKEIAFFGEKWHKSGDRKITLNFALANEFPCDPDVLIKYFNPDLFLIKMTALNPTYTVNKMKWTSYLKIDGYHKYPLVEKLRSKGYEVIVSIGPSENDENLVGSNCGQLAIKALMSNKNVISFPYEELVQYETVSDLLKS